LIAREVGVAEGAEGDARVLLEEMLKVCRFQE